MYASDLRRKSGGICDAYKVTDMMPKYDYSDFILEPIVLDEVCRGMMCRKAK